MRSNQQSRSNKISNNINTTEKKVRSYNLEVQATKLMQALATTCNILKTKFCNSRVTKYSPYIYIYIYKSPPRVGVTSSESNFGIHNKLGVYILPGCIHTSKGKQDTFTNIQNTITPFFAFSV